jgi:3-hydroxyisobutyrate dehydrogenase-like beta-hydroxyacid dehydrogenase
VTAIAVLGLGEAGGRLAVDLAAAGADVRGYDPDAGADVAGVTRAPDVQTAVSGTDFVLSVNSAAVAAEAAVAALPALGGAVYADLNTTAPALKRKLAAVVERFADVALLGPVPATGLRTAALASGAGAQAFADALGPLGMPVHVVSDRAGDAATLKLLRSVFMKGLAASVTESLDAAEAAGHREWIEEQIAEVIGEPMRERLVDGSRRHAARRVEEMEAARELLLELGVEPRIASASAALLAEMAAASR